MQRFLVDRLRPKLGHAQELTTDQGATQLTLEIQGKICGCISFRWHANEQASIPGCMPVKGELTGAWPVTNPSRLALLVKVMSGRRSGVVGC